MPFWSVPSDWGPRRLRGRARVAVPVGLILVIMVVDLLTDPSVHLGPLLVAAPAITASFGGPVLTGAVALLALGAQTLISALHGGVMTSNHEAQLVGLAVVSVFVVGFRYARDRHAHELSQARMVAEAAQRALLRPVPPRLGPLRIASTYLAAQEEAQVGGDLYAAVRTPDGTRVMIGDVRGSGLDAVWDAALLLGAFRAAAHRSPCSTRTG